MKKRTTIIVFTIIVILLNIISCKQTNSKLLTTLQFFTDENYNELIEDIFQNEIKESEEMGFDFEFKIIEYDINSDSIQDYFVLIDSKIYMGNAGKPVYLIISKPNNIYEKIELSYSQDNNIGILSEVSNEFNNISFYPKYYNPIFSPEWEFIEGKYQLKNKELELTEIFNINSDLIENEDMYILDYRFELKNNTTQTKKVKMGVKFGDKVYYENQNNSPKIFDIQPNEIVFIDSKFIIPKSKIVLENGTTTFPDDIELILVP